MVAWIRRPHGTQEGMLPFFRRACQTALEGQTVYSSNFPPRHAQNQARHSEALLPRRGKQRRIRTPAAPLAPAGQGSVARNRPFLSPCTGMTHGEQNARPTSRGAAVPPASAVGSDSTHTHPTSRGRALCVSFRLGRWCEQTAVWGGRGWANGRRFCDDAPRNGGGWRHCRFRGSYPRPALCPWLGFLPLCKHACYSLQKNSFLFT